MKEHKKKRNKIKIKRVPILGNPLDLKVQQKKCNGKAFLAYECEL